VQLIQVRDQSELWSDAYDRPLGELLALQGDVARTIARRLPLEVAVAEGPGQTTFGAVAVDPRAYEDYLRGRFAFNTFTLDGFRESLEYFERAVERDTDFALAHVGISQAYGLMVAFGDVSASEGREKARQAALRALELDDTLGAAHTALGYHAFAYDYDFAAAEEHFRRAIELAPGDPSGYGGHAEVLVATGRPKEAIAAMRRALRLDPLSLGVNAHLCLVLHFARRHHEAIAQCQATLELDPRFLGAHYNLAMAFEAAGLLEQSVAAWLEVVRIENLPPEFLARLEAAFRNGGWTAYWQADIEEGLRMYESGWQGAGYLSFAYASLGDREAALQWLETAYADRDAKLAHINVDPRLDSLRDDPRFQELAGRIGAPSR
jgi:tetratricopeptide (TPR) repeat protein